MNNPTTPTDESINSSDDPVIQKLISKMEIVQPEDKGGEEPEPQKEVVKPTQEVIKPSEDIVVQDSAQAGQPDNSNDEMQSAISKAVSGATEKHMKVLEEVVRKLPKEELAELEENNPQLFKKLKNSIPEVFVVEEEKTQPKDKAERLEKLLEAIVTAQEASSFEKWRMENEIEIGDYEKKKQEFEETAKTLFELDKISDWDQALRLASDIHFPHLSGKPVDTEKLAKMQGQRVSASNMAPASRSAEFSDEDFAIMRREGVTEDQYREAIRGEILPPGIL